mgnify:CR=1 FL=1
MREDSADFFSQHEDDFNFDFASEEEIEQFKSEELHKFKWNKALANGARHLVNDMGACGTTGDVNSDMLPEILWKYYTHSFEELEYHIIEHRPYGYDWQFNEFDFNNIDQVNPGYEFLKYMI